ncbi:hypothetical protein Ais01nite_61290 [Asanoa ishikariensis]|uniref:Pimeloyl-ACP methyl ester carboxylesterase n=1 Tax=Asanoa ishikariensis TaxID=137265 RepID=A0A1H3P5G6_9ACTN|nr:alpha/beta hydrolase [Asanoa ishikariensis]GIF68094.1 hypothetical protein Ais01nite_61290 [Asanoa ishikariensis]SDY96357.1 Pimeloyl-ACP methyl ester carboxylesterase [Asanoa ishikariensis]
MERLLAVGADSVWVGDPGGSGTPVVLVHPGWGDASIWDGVLDRLPGSIRPIRYDNRGYGRSPAPTRPFSWHDDLVAVTADLAGAVVVGHSGGGAAAIGLALSHPERVASLLPVTPGVADYPWPPDDYFARFEALFAADDRDGLVELGLRTWARADPGPAARAQVGGAVAAMVACGDLQQPDPPAFDRLHTITAPSRVLIGGLDHPSVVDCGHAVAARLPHCELSVIPEADHLLPLRHPDLVAEAIADLVSGSRGMPR